MSEETLIMIADRGFYPITCLVPEDKTIKDAAKAHGELNNHVNRVEDMNGNVLWERIKH